MSAKSLPTIALVGLTNVGKSSVFNLLLKTRRNIVAREAGTTRDSIRELVEIAPDKYAWLIDTAGLKDPEDNFEATIQAQINLAIQTADVICLLVEANRILNQQDRWLAKVALKSKKTTILIINKWDLNWQARADQFSKLGIKDIFFLSTTTKQGTDKLLTFFDQLLDKIKPKIAPQPIRLALLGRPNVGKSALFNCLAKKQQALVSERAGTTRDLNRQQVRFNQQTLELLDTAGIRRAGKIQVGVEKFSVGRTLMAITESDICLLLVDVNDLAVATDQKIAGMVKETGKGLIIVISKWDTLDKNRTDTESIKNKVRQEFDFVPWASLIFTSAITGQNVTKIFELSLNIYERRQQNIPTPQLNRCLQKAINSHPPAGLKSTQPKLNYAVQIDNNPPTFQFFGSSTKYIHWSYKRFLERKIREEFDYQGSGLILAFKEKH
ncbi:MAG: ribosome biogenesis GTPase Der [Candidatus Saccharibacteria bacterium]|nr:ribosome biogenesis GTPase Der [Candidatus Saccharibacteria bacterium]